MQLTERHPDRPGFRPLYQQVRDLLLSRISSGAWRPAEALPSEQALAAELGVSQGTVRKALDSLAADNLVERRQGKGTYVAQHTQESAQFRFFKLSYEEGARALPTCRQSSISRRLARPEERRRLNLVPKSEVFAIKRDRLVDGEPALHEVVCLPAAIFENLDKHHPLPNTLYTFYQAEYGVSITSANESIRAVGADKETARALRISENAPVLLVDRTAFDIAGQAVEFRRTYYDTTRFNYAVELN